MQNISGQKRQKSSALPRNKRGALTQTHILDLRFRVCRRRYAATDEATELEDANHRFAVSLISDQHSSLRFAGRLLRRCATTTVPRIGIKRTEGLRLAVPTQHPRGRSPRMSREPARNVLCESLRGFTRAGRLLRRTATTVLPFGIKRTEGLRLAVPTQHPRAEARG